MTRTAGATVQVTDGLSLDAGTVQSAVDEWFGAHAQRWSDVYSNPSLTNVIYQQRRDTALAWIEQLDLGASATALELGCGSGLMSVRLASGGLHVSATDRSSRMLRLARRHARNADVAIRVAQADAHKIGFANASFDLVLALGVVPWLHSPRAALLEIARVLRPGGYALLSADNRLRLTHLLDPQYQPWLSGARRAFRTAAGRAPSVGIRPKLHGPREFDALVDSVGLRRLTAATLGFGPLTVLGRRLLPDRVGVRVHWFLQHLADRHPCGLRWRGSQYLVLATRR